MTRPAINTRATAKPYMRSLAMIEIAPSLKNVAARPKKATKIQGMVFTPMCVMNEFTQCAGPMRQVVSFAQPLSASHRPLVGAADRVALDATL